MEFAFCEEWAKFGVCHVIRVKPPPTKPFSRIFLPSSRLRFSKYGLGTPGLPMTLSKDRSASLTNYCPPSSSTNTSSPYLPSFPSTLEVSLNVKHYWHLVSFFLPPLSFPSTLSPAITITHYYMNAHYLYGQPPPSSPCLLTKKQRVESPKRYLKPPVADSQQWAQP